MAAEKLPAHFYLGLTTLAASIVLLYFRTEPVYTLFYIFAWWSYILLVDGLVYRYRGNSLIVNRTGEFMLLVCWSVFFWLIFETFNFYVNSWHYVGVVRRQWLRWVGYCLAYGTVLPALFETTEFLETRGWCAKARVKPLSPAREWYGPFTAAGIACVVLPVIWPRYFFPLIWGCFTFLLEPVNHHFGGKSLMREWEEGSARKVCLLTASGLVCGVLWELWNYWAGSKWVYTLPFVQRHKIFEMPVAGYVGFPAFAVECYVMYSFVSLFRGNRSWEMDTAEISAEVDTYLAWVATLMIGLYAYIVFQGIDQKTVHSFARIYP